MLSVIGPFVAALGLIAALLVLLNPGGVGTRLRQSPGWWSIPGMRRASHGALPFAALLLLYVVPAPLGAFGLMRAVTSGSTPPAVATSAVAGLGVGGGPTATATAAGTPSSAPSSAPNAPTAAAPTPAPTARPAATLVPAVTLTLPPSPTAALPTLPVVAATPTPTQAPVTQPTPAPTAPPPSPPPTQAPSNLCGAPSNPWGYNFCGGGTISNPPSSFCNYFACIASFWRSTNGYVEQCSDGMYSHSGGVSGSCSSHGGNRRPLNP